MIPGSPPLKGILLLDGFDSSSCAILKEKKCLKSKLDSGACDSVGLADFYHKENKFVY